MKPIISMIAVIGENRELGKENKLLWHIPGELPRFKKITMGHPIIMGRKTFESIGRVLPGRKNIVITREENYKPEGTVVVHSIEKAIEEAKKTEKEEIFIIGGGKIFELAMPLADKLYLTLVHSKFPGADTFFPDYHEFKKVISREEVSENGYNYEFIDLER